MTSTINYPQVSIVISTRNRCNTLKRCLDSIVAQDYPKELLELLVLDDASEDETPKEVPKYFQGLKMQGWANTYFFRNEKNLGIAANRWILGQKVSPESEMVLFLDDDAYLKSDCLKILVEYLLEHPDVGVVGPLIVYAKNPNETLYGAGFVSSWTARYYNKSGAEPMICDWVDPVCLLTRLNLVRKIGGFWPGYYRSHEGVDFCLRIKKIGYQIVYCPRTVAQHDTDFSRPKEERLYYIYRNKILLVRRNFPFFQIVFASSLILLFGLPKYLLESIKFHKKIVFPEIKIIFLSVWHGFLGREGR